MAYKPFQPCPPDTDNVAEALALRGCQPLPRRRCFSRTPSKAPPISSLPGTANPFPASLPDSSVLWPPSAFCKSFSCLPAHLGFDMDAEAARFLLPTRSNLDLTVPQLLRIAQDHSTPIRLALDVGGSSGTFAARMKLDVGAVVVTTTMDLGAPYNKAAALRGLLPLHVPLQ
ncbi:hypothetical protein Taro_040866 [Colocasia esculenta]|uniref:Uncharacterized protein n=1 Tax=Colocasia esculenta TaxID=4460 RepID=A0A843WCX1_COLES|nr:hypothetical protein [Colocasia esculenta]